MPPSPPLPATFGKPLPGIAAGQVEAAWWRAFDDPALDALIGRALAANHDIGAAAARVDQARAVLRENRQGFWPEGGAAASYERRRRSEVETSFGEPRETDAYRAAVDASWEIDLFGRVRRSVEAAAADAGSAQALLRGVQASVAAEVAAAYFELRGLEAELAVVKELRANQRASLGVVERLQAAGSANELDRLRAEALLRTVEVTAPELERRRAAAINALAILTGRQPQGFSPPTAMPAGEPLTLRSIAVGEPAELLRRRPDIAAAERRLAAATARVGVATADLYPRVEVQGSIGLLAGSLEALGGAGAVSWFIAPIVRWAFLDLGRVRARIDAGEARAREALIVYDQTVLRALQETANAFEAYGAAGATVALRLKEAAANREAARLARLRFASGGGGLSRRARCGAVGLRKPPQPRRRPNQPAARHRRHLQGARRRLGDVPEPGKRLQRGGRHAGHLLTMIGERDRPRHARIWRTPFGAAPLREPEPRGEHRATTDCGPGPPSADPWRAAADRAAMRPGLASAGRQRLDDAALRDRAVPAAVDPVAQRALHGAKVADLALHLRQMLARDRIDVSAVALALVGKVEQRPDLVECEAQVARAPDEAQAAEMVRRVAPVIAAGARRGGQEPDPLVVADRLHLGVGRPRELSDREPLFIRHGLDPVATTGSM